MIRSYDSTKRVTPKTKAKELLKRGLINKRDYWYQGHMALVGLTDKEIKLIKEQVNKITDRIIEKYLN